MAQPLEESPDMLKIALIVWLVLGGTFAGMGILVVLLTTASGQDMRLIPVGAAAGALIAIPAALYVAKRILAVTGGRA